MNKFGRKKSNDPAQESLRSAKEGWNAEVSKLVNDMIHFKKLINGWPNKFHMQRSTINSPVPNAAEALNSVTQHFAEIASTGNKLIEQQLQYSNSKVKKAGLIINASNPLTRLWNKIRHPGFGSSEAAKMNRFRTSILNTSADIYKDLEHYEDEILGSGPDSIFAASKILSKVVDDWRFITSTLQALHVDELQAFRKNLPYKPLDEELGEEDAVPVSEDKAIETNKKSKVPEVKEPTVEPVKENINFEFKLKDFFTNITDFQDIDAKKCHNLIIAYRTNPSEALEKSIVKEYDVVLDKLNKANNKQAGSLQELSKMLHDERKVKASAPTRFLKNIKHQVFSDKTSAIRVNSAHISKQLRHNLDKFMNGLEKSFDVDVALSAADDIKDALIKLKSLTDGLKALLKGVGYEDKFMKMLLNNQLTEYDVDIGEAERQKLHKDLQRRNVKELGKLYNK